MTVSLLSIDFKDRRPATNRKSRAGLFIGYWQEELDRRLALAFRARVAANVELRRAAANSRVPIVGADRPRLKRADVSIVPPPYIRFSVRQAQ